MKKVIAFAASNSKTSINKQLVTYSSSLLETINVDILDLNEFSVPTYSVDIEEENGIPDNAKKLFDKITDSNGLIVSLAEHNGTYTAAFKSIFDWMSRIEMKLFQDKPMLLMSTSPGARGGQTVLEQAKQSFPRFGTQVVASFSLPSFGDNFKNNKVENEALNEDLTKAVSTLQQHILS